MSAKKDRTGEYSRNKKGLLMRIVKYYNNKNCDIVFVDTHERRSGVSYVNFKRGKVAANLRDYPLHKDCSYKQAKFFTVGIGAVLIGAIVALIWLIAK